MSRPLIVTDCDEVLLHMVVPFRQWLDEAHAVHFDFTREDFGEALRHKDSGIPLERELVWTLLTGFFATEMHRQQPIRGAVEAMHSLSEVADIVVLTNIGDDARTGREAQLRQVGLDFPVVCNRGGKGPRLARLIEERQPGVTVFIDDLASNHASVAEHKPDVWRLHMVGEPELAPRIAKAPAAHERIDRWSEAEAWIRERLAG
jgi:hypothetical protein